MVSEVCDVGICFVNGIMWKGSSLSFNLGTLLQIVNIGSWNEATELMIAVKDMGSEMLELLAILLQCL